jgi:2-hydroxychromene-2-carboxylate isomerase
MMAKKMWIKGAIKHPGAFTKKAKAAGMSTSAFAAKVLSPKSKASTQTKRQAALAQTLRKFRKPSKPNVKRAWNKLKKTAGA